MTDAGRPADAALLALSRWLRVEAAVRALQDLTAEQRALLPGVLPDIDDLATLVAALRCERELGSGSSQFTAAFGLPPNWRSRSRRAFRDLLICQVPTRASEPCARATEIAEALQCHQLPAHGHEHPLSRVITAHGGKPSFATVRRAIFSATSAVAETPVAA
jgi:hypothetical protein